MAKWQLESYIPKEEVSGRFRALVLQEKMVLEITLSLTSSAPLGRSLDFSESQVPHH